MNKVPSRRPKTVLSKYKLRKTSIEDIEFVDFINPYTFASLCLSSQTELVKWLQNRGLIAKSLDCHKCGSKCTLSVRNKLSEGFSLRCAFNKNHEYSIKRNSFFSHSQVLLRDLLVFIRTYLNKASLKLCADEAGIDYHHTAVEWAKSVRKIFVEYVYREVVSEANPMKLRGIVEVDESLFGRKVKNHRGDPRSGQQVWILGMVERSTNKIILYPVADRSSQTLLSIIKKHVVPGSRIYSDGWRGYSTLHDCGYEHYIVNHTNTFKQVYQNPKTGEVIHCHTNQIEGAWQHAKKHFR